MGKGSPVADQADGNCMITLPQKNEADSFPLKEEKQQPKTENVIHEIKKAWLPDMRWKWRVLQISFPHQDGSLSGKHAKKCSYGGIRSGIPLSYSRFLTKKKQKAKNQMIVRIHLKPETITLMASSGSRVLQIPSVLDCSINIRAAVSPAVGRPWQKQHHWCDDALGESLKHCSNLGQPFFNFTGMAELESTATHTYVLRHIASNV